MPGGGNYYNGSGDQSLEDMIKSTRRGILADHLAYKRHFLFFFAQYGELGILVITPFLSNRLRLRGNPLTTKGAAGAIGCCGSE